MFCEGSVWRQKRRGKGERLRDHGTCGDEHEVGWGMQGEEKGRDSVTMEPVGMNMELAEEREKAYDTKVSLCHHESWDLTKEGGSPEGNEHLTWDSEQVGNGETEWFAHAECEKPVGLSSGVDQICRLPGTAFGVGKGKWRYDKVKSELHDSDMKQHENLPFVATEVGLEGIMLNEISQRTQRSSLCEI